jgi:small GTP-binding protein
LKKVANFPGTPLSDDRPGGVDLRGNPLEEPPVEVVAKGKESVALYFEFLRGERKAVNEAKVLLVGDGGSGKTSLMKQLLELQFDPQTHGINIDEYTLDVSDRRLRVHIWDFGGQEIMHATHQFFLSKRSVYILVVDSRRDDKTEYWLKHVEAFGGNSPVLIAINKIDEHPSFDINRRFLMEKYPSITRIVRVSCANGEGINELKGALTPILSRLESTTTIWPASWFAVKERVEVLREDYISYGQFRQLCRECSVIKESEQQALAEFLHDLGIALHFRDLALRDTNVISPHWLTNGVYPLVNSAEIVSTGGILDVSLLDSLLETSKYPEEKHNFVIEMMKKFELCYAIDSNRVLFPTLLPIEEPSVPIPADAEKIRFVLDYEFLPKSVLPRLIVRMHDEIDGGLRWRTGVVLKNFQLDARAIIKADEEEKRISVEVFGPLRREYLSIIVHSIREINASFERLKITEKVMLPDRTDVGISYEHLVRLSQRGIRTYMPDGTEREYDVQQLMGHVSATRASEEEVLQLLRRLVEKDDTEESLAKKANSVLLLEPNFMGIGLNVNALVERFMTQIGRRRETRPPTRSGKVAKEG